MKKKSLIALILASVITAGVATMSACSEEVQSLDPEATTTEYSEDLVSTNLIVAVYKRNIELHKADVYTLFKGKYMGSDGGYSYSYNDKLVLDCDYKNPIVTKQYIAYPNGMPAESEYDVLCEKCFGK